MAATEDTETIAEGDVVQVMAEGDPIALQLRKLYQDAASEPLPQHLIMLLARLDEAEERR